MTSGRLQLLILEPMLDPLICSTVSQSSRAIAIPFCSQRDPSLKGTALAGLLLTLARKATHRPRNRILRSCILTQRAAAQRFTTCTRNHAPRTMVVL